MPIYDYVCARCGSFQIMRPMAKANTAATCPGCGRRAARGLARPHLRGSRAALSYLVGERNEKSANEPTTEHRLNGGAGEPHAHRSGGSAGHGHAHPGHAHPGRAHPSRAHRPWMIGH